MPYHVIITLHTTVTSRGADSETKLDLSLDELHQRILAPRSAGEPIVIGGRSIPLDTIERIQITYSDQPGTPQLPAARAARQSSGLMSLAFVSDAAYFARQQRDVTDEFITGPPGRVASDTTSGVAMNTQADPRKVFVVYGRNVALRDALFALLRALDLQPIEWTQAIQATGKASPYISDILDAGMSMAQAVVVLLTPDDEVRLREALWGANELPHEKEVRFQARPNVLYEAGLAMGRYPDRTVLVELGTLRPFSDVGGIHTVRGLGSAAQRQDLAQRLRSARCMVNLDGTDWHTAGDFTLRLDEQHADGAGRSANRPAGIAQPAVRSTLDELWQQEQPAVELREFQRQLRETLREPSVVSIETNAKSLVPQPILDAANSVEVAQEHLTAWYDGLAGYRPFLDMVKRFRQAYFEFVKAAQQLDSQLTTSIARYTAARRAMIDPTIGEHLAESTIRDDDLRRYYLARISGQIHQQAVGTDRQTALDYRADFFDQLHSDASVTRLVDHVQEIIVRLTDAADTLRRALERANL